MAELTQNTKKEMEELNVEKSELESKVTELEE